MNALPPLSEGPHRRGSTPGDLDALLRGFFRAEMPVHWPVLQLPAAPVAPPVAGRSRLARSRVALAASLLLLLAGHLAVIGLSADRPPSPADLDAGRSEATNRVNSPVPKVTKPGTRVREDKSLDRTVGESRSLHHPH
jgi:hypothetical protein